MRSRSTADRRPALVLHATSIGMLLAAAVGGCDCGGPSGRPFDQLVWESMNGPPGANHGYFAQDPYRPDDVYLGATRSIYRSRDRGDHWERILEGESTGVAFTAGRALVCSGRTVQVLEGAALSDAPPCRRVFAGADVVYAALDTDRSEPGTSLVRLLRAADDDALTFADIGPADADLTAAFGSTPIGTSDTVAIAQLFETEAGLLARIDLLDASEARTAATLLWTADDGATWAPASFTLTSPLAIMKVAQDPADADHLVLAAGEPGPSPQPFHPVAELVLDSWDGGATWAAATAIVERAAQKITDVDVVGTSYVLANFDAAIVELVGPDHQTAVTWPQPGVPGYLDPYLVDDLTFASDRTEQVWARGQLGWDGVIRSDDAGATWTRTMNGVAAAPAPNLAVHPTDGDVVVACGNLGFLPHITRDGGATWEPLGGTFLMADEVGFDPHDPDHMLVVSELSAIAASEDGGQSWQRLAPTFTTARVHDFAVSTAGQGVIYAANLGNNIGALPDANRLAELPELNWQNLQQSPDYTYDIDVHPTDPDIAYATYSPKIFESFAAVWRYDAAISDNHGWTEVLRVDGASGMTSVAIDPSRPDTVYAAATGARARLYVSHDGGGSWDRFGGADFTLVTVHEVAVDAGDGQRVWAAPWGGGLFESTDGGATWDERRSPTRSIVTLLAEGDALLAADRTAPVIWESGDGGATWAEIVRLDGDRFARIMSLVRHEGELYFSALDRLSATPPALGGAIFRVGPGGVEEMTTALPGPVLRFASHDAGLYAVTHLRGVYRLDGATWVDLSAGLPDMGFFDVVVDDRGDLLVAGGSDLDPYLVRRIGDDTVVHEIYRSTDGGTTWQPLLGDDRFGSAIKRLVPDPRRPEYLYAATGRGLWMSPDRGQTWRAQPGMAFADVGALAIGSGQLYAGTLGGGVQGGSIGAAGDLSWRAAKGPFPRIHNLQIEVSPADPATLYVSSFPGGVFRTVDGGQSWMESNFALPSFDVSDPRLQGYYSLAIDPLEPTRLYLGVYRRGVFRSEDGGATWMPMRGTPAVDHAGIRRLAVDPISGRLILATDDGPWISHDHAATWEQVGSGLDTGDLLGVEVDATGRVFAGTAGYGMYVLDDDTGSWDHLGSTVGIGEWHVWERRLYQYSALLFAPDDPQSIYLGHFPSGFFVSHDQGASWTAQVLGLGNDGMFSLAVHPEDPARLFAGTYNGIVRSDDRGTTWRQSSAGMPPEQWPFAVVIDDANPQIMYASTKNGQNKGFCDRNDFCGVLMKSTDGGATWSAIMNGMDDDREYYMIVIHPDDHDLLFVSTSVGVFASEDAGASWVAVNQGLPTLEHRIRDNVAKNMWLTADRRHLVLGIADHGVWRTDLAVLGL